VTGDEPVRQPTLDGEGGQVRLGAPHIGEHAPVPGRPGHLDQGVGQGGQWAAEEDHVPVGDRLGQPVRGGHAGPAGLQPGGVVRIPPGHVETGVAQAEQDRAADQAGADHGGPYLRAGPLHHLPTSAFRFRCGAVHPASVAR
jgi:hypothetical protein